ncbi:hypothetical protein QBC37DRAFT_423320 [Rhypophila decipiens]|uniref:Secreted protein n=1 Tax=Rhypophila decipiens TaxID=261697 RepID=A0AAN7B7V2_9PEZI|nr:hypothetical protein QBC37DRAFT_423320 [Rhypophila decipiens]
MSVLGCFLFRMIAHSMESISPLQAGSEQKVILHNYIVITRHSYGTGYHGDEICSGTVPNRSELYLILLTSGSEHLSMCHFH